MNLKFKVVDVFCNGFFSGNPVCVVFSGKESIPDEKMLKIANWMNLSETTFLSADEHADYHLRIFTPDSELPFAGHPTLGSAWAYKESMSIDKKALTQRCKYGNVDITTDDDILWFSLPHFKMGSTINSAEIKKHYSIDTVSSPQIVTTGPIWAVAQVSSLDALASISNGGDPVVQWMHEVGVEGINFFYIEENNNIIIRTFFHANKQIVEDPACGSGNAAVAAYLLEQGQFPQGGYSARQGKFLGRNALVQVRFEGSKIMIGGQCQTRLFGELQL